MRWTVRMLTSWPSATVNARILRCPHAGYLSAYACTTAATRSRTGRGHRAVRRPAAQRALTLGVPRRRRDAGQRAEPPHVEAGLGADHLQLLEAKSAPPRLSTAARRAPPRARWSPARAHA